MTPYEQLLEEAVSYDITVIEKHFVSKAKGLLKGNKAGIRKDMSTVEKKCTLAEEMIHYLITVGNILDQSDILNRKQELRARQLTYEKLIPLSAIVQAHQSGVRGRFEIAEYLEVTEEFLQATINRYRDKYGISVSIDNFIIFLTRSV
ncbi:ImmA/IrrE family metallo-endopeptidase [Paenibacillus larvae]|nr:ImmA/IrrE family metallo-endopeptidase [Paenibacillus larvae]MDT2295577.1 ImmA/IrrE family metallo-endopeptidase [Paenibacillus larvae]